MLALALAGVVLAAPVSAGQDDGIAALRAWLEQRAYEQALDRGHAPQGRIARLLEGLKIEPVLLSEGASGSTGSVFGLHYDFRKHLARPIEIGTGHRTGLALTFASRGTIAFEARENPQDLLETSLELGLFGRDVVGHDRLSELEKQAAAGDADARERIGTLRVQANELAAKLSAESGLSYAQTIRSEEYEKFLAANPDARWINQSLWTWHADLRAGLETDQRFTQRQSTFGLQLGGQFWSDDPDTTSYNVFEYPFVVTRWLTGDDAAEPERGGWPSLQLGLDLVDPLQDDLRAALGEEDPFWRARLDVGTTANFGTIAGRKLKASLDWRLWQELDAPSSIENQDLDRFEWFQFALTDVSGVYLSYATGRLPFDVDPGSVFTLGWSWSQ